MNKVILTIAVLLLTGCGMAEDLSRGCTGDMDMLCDMLFGRDSERTDDLDDRVSNNEERIELLESRLGDVRGDVETLEELVNVLESDADADTTALTDRIEGLEDEAEQIAIDIAELDTDTRIVEMIDPCGDNPGRFDEILLVTAGGDIIAYFRENGSRQYLTALSDGNYQTTDRQRCNFSIVSGEYVE